MYIYMIIYALQHILRHKNYKMAEKEWLHLNARLIEAREKSAIRGNRLLGS